MMMKYLQLKINKANIELTNVCQNYSNSLNIYVLYVLQACKSENYFW